MVYFSCNIPEEADSSPVGSGFFCPNKKALGPALTLVLRSFLSWIFWAFKKMTGHFNDAFLMLVEYYTFMLKNECR